MKRLIVALSFAAVAIPAMAAGPPYDQNLVDRTLPELRVESLPVASLEVASAGNTRSDVEISVDEAARQAANGPSGLASGPWLNDHHFIAPAQ
jgi:hypothetical protein